MSARELEQVGDSLVCPKCKPKRVMIEAKAYKAKQWVPIAWVCVQCGFEFALKDAPN